jgi:hypothetical protein
MWDANHNPADYGENRGRGVIHHINIRNFFTKEMNF